MSGPWYYTTTPDIWKEAFRLLALFDEREDQSDWDEVEAEIVAAVAAAESRADAISTRLNAIRCALIQVQSRLI